MEQAPWYSSLGSKYEHAFGHDPGLGIFLKKALAYLPPQARVLDVGCGTGKPVAISLAESGHSVMGIDISDVMVELSKTAVPNGRFEVADMRKFEPPEGIIFDATFQILSVLDLRERDEIEAMALRWSRWLRVGGTLCIGTIAAEDLQPKKGYDDDGRCARNIAHRLMGSNVAMTLPTLLGWEKLQQETGFDILETMTDLFIPPKESDCDKEEHYVIVAKKVKNLY